MPFKKGHDPNRYSKENRHSQAIINGYSLGELARGYGRECIELLGCIVQGVNENGEEDKKISYNHRLKACSIILDRGFGKPLDMLTVQDHEARNRNRTIDQSTSTSDLELMINQLESKVIA